MLGIPEVGDTVRIPHKRIQRDSRGFEDVYGCDCTPKARDVQRGPGGIRVWAYCEKATERVTLPIVARVREDGSIITARTIRPTYVLVARAEKAAA